MTTITKIIPIYGSDDCFARTYGKSLFPSDQALRIFNSGDRKDRAIEAGLIFHVGKTMSTDQPEELFQFLLSEKKAASIERVRRDFTEPVEPIKSRTATVRPLQDADARLTGYTPDVTGIRDNTAKPPADDAEAW
jgi:hypothetical protein